MAGFLPNNYTTAKVLKQLDLFWPKCLLKDAKALSDVAKHLMKHLVSSSQVVTRLMSNVSQLSQTFTGASTFVPVQVMKVLPVTLLDKVNDRFQSN